MLDLYDLRERADIIGDWADYKAAGRPIATSERTWLRRMVRDLADSADSACAKQRETAAHMSKVCEAIRDTADVLRAMPDAKDSEFIADMAAKLRHRLKILVREVELSAALVLQPKETVKPAKKTAANVVRQRGRI